MDTGVFCRCRDLVDEFKKAGCDMSIRNKQNVTVLEAVSRRRRSHVTEKELFGVCSETTQGSSSIPSLL